MSKLYFDSLNDSAYTHSLLSEQKMLYERLLYEVRDELVVQRSMQENLHKEYTAQVKHLRDLAVQGFVYNSDATRSGFDDLLQTLQSSESKSKGKEHISMATGQLAEKLRDIAAKHQTSERELESEARPSLPSTTALREYVPSEQDPFAFTATIVTHRENKVENTVVRAKMDTGCDENWMSAGILARAGLMDLLKPAESEETYLGFGGTIFNPIGKLEVTWYGVNAAKSWTNTFLVHQDGPFDMVLGSIWITEDSILTLSRPALALRMTKFTKGIFKLCC